MATEELGGYRLVRKLGEGPRAEVFVAHPLRDEQDAVATAIKVTRDGVAESSVLAEAAALTRAAGDHVVRLLDAAPGLHDAPVLILERLPGGTLGRLLRHRPQLGIGEAITILAPVVECVARLHEAGVAHGGIRAEAVLFDGTGAPVLACFGRAVLIEPGLPPARREVEPAIATDVSALASLVRQVLGASSEGVPLVGWLDAEPPDGTREWLAQLSTRIFALGEAEPVAFGTRIGTGESVPGRVVTGAPVAPTEPGPQVLPDWIEGFVPRPLIDRALPVIERLRTSLTAVRRPVWIAAGLVAVALIGAVTLIPQGGQDAATRPAEPQPEATEVSQTGPLEVSGPVASDDPVAALLALLEARERCIRDLSVLCLDAVGQAGSAALASDQQLVRGILNGEESHAGLDLEGAEVTLVERLGDSALVDLAEAGDSAPASVLLMKGEAGWRIRDYLDG